MSIEVLIRNIEMTDEKVRASRVSDAINYLLSDKQIPESDVISIQLLTGFNTQQLTIFYRNH